MKTACGTLDELEPARLKMVDREVVEPHATTTDGAAPHHKDSYSSELDAIGDSVTRFGIVRQKPRDGAG